MKTSTTRDKHVFRQFKGHVNLKYKILYNKGQLTIKRTSRVKKPSPEQVYSSLVLGNVWKINLFFQARYHTFRLP